MVVNSTYIQRLRTQGRYHISQELEEILLDRLGTEPEPYEYTEQDLAEQARKIINRYETPKGRLELLYRVDELQMKLESLQNRNAMEVNEAEEDAGITF